VNLKAYKPLNFQNAPVKIVQLSEFCRATVHLPTTIMAEIPYHEWLGLDSRIKNPHHFQLLGVSSKVVDSDSFRIQVLAAAQAKLEMLDRVEDAGNKQLVEKLKQRINTARDVLCDPQKRADYVERIAVIHRKP
jgi:hypothetical protein